MRNGYEWNHTGFWSFIHSLFREIISGLKRVIITGGTGGLGRAIAAAFGTSGWEVVQLGRNDLDLSNRDKVEDYFLAKPCNLLICAAGAIDDVPLLRMLECAWDTVYALNYEAAKCCAVAAMPQMVDKSSGHIVFISSQAAIHPAIGQAAYAASKAALLGLTSTLAESWGKKGIRVNAVLPGFLDTQMTASVSDTRRGRVKDEHHLGRFNTPEAAAEFILFLEERMPHTSGQVFQLDSRRGFF